MSPADIHIIKGYRCTSTEMQYTGVSVTIPANSIFNLYASAHYNGASIKSVCIYQDTNLAAGQDGAASAYKTVPHSGYTTKEITINVYAS